MRKKVPKIIIAIFLTIFILQLISLIALFVIPRPSQAIEVPQIRVPIGEFDKDDFSEINDSKQDEYLTIPWIGEYIRAIYKYAIGIVGILAAVILMLGGVIWITAGGSSTQIGEAKAWIGAALTGLVLALCSYLILNTVNSELVDLQPIRVKIAKPVSSCVSEGSKYECGQFFEAITGYDENNKPTKEYCCGTKCDVLGEQCKKTFSGEGAKQCPTASQVPASSPSELPYWKCEWTGEGNNVWCSSNNDKECASPNICNMQVKLPKQPTEKGACQTKGQQNQICGENADCMSGLICTNNRCQGGGTEGNQCNGDGSCVGGLNCIFRFPGTFPGLCYDGSTGDPCCHDSDCDSNNCDRPALDVCTTGDVFDHHCL